MKNRRTAFRKFRNEVSSNRASYVSRFHHGFAGARAPAM
jgi:hypothetical protein